MRICPKRNANKPERKCVKDSAVGGGAIEEKGPEAPRMEASDAGTKAKERGKKTRIILLRIENIY